MSPMLASSVLVLFSGVCRAKECVAYCGIGGKGFANTLNAANWALAYSMHHNLSFLLTAILPPGYGIEDSFIRVFGTPEWDCDGKLWHDGTPVPGVRAVSAEGDLTTPASVRTATCKDYDAFSDEDGDVDDVEFNIIEEKTIYTTAPCRSILQISDCFPMSHFGSTRDYWRQRYDRANIWNRAGRPIIPALRIVIHYRLGDVEIEDKWQKRSTWADVEAALGVILRGCAKWPLEFQIATDSPAHPEVAKLYQHLQESQHRVEEPAADLARHDFDRLVDADILVCAGSPFCRTAAVLSYNIALASRTTPLKTFDNLTVFDNVILYDADTSSMESRDLNKQAAVTLEDKISAKRGP